MLREVSSTYERCMTGLLGEVAVASYIGFDSVAYLSERNWNSPFDIIIDGKQFDVKSKLVKIPIRTSNKYNCDIEVKQFNSQGNNYGYIFCAVFIGLKEVEILGYISKQEFKNIAQLHLKGYKSYFQPLFTYPCDAYDAPLSALHSIKDFHIEQTLF